MRAALLCLLLALAPAVAPADAAPRRRPGKVVRIERPRRVAVDPVHLCQVTSTEEGRMTCYGQEPAVGSTVRFLDETGVRGGGVVRAVGPSAVMDTCQTGTAHDVTVDLDGPSSGPRFSFFALQGVSLAEGARIMLGVTIPALPRRDQERLWAAVDRDGDTAPDMAITASECASEVDVQALSPDGRRVTAYCLDYWMDDGHGYARAGRDIIYQCQ